MSRAFFLPGLIFYFFNTSIGQAQVAELITDRPDQTESASIVPVGSLQVESGVMVENDKANNVVNYIYNTTLVRYGIHRNWELRLIAEYNGLKTISPGVTEVVYNGFSPLTLGTKINIVESDGHLPQVAFLGHITLRTGSKEFQPDFVIPDFRFSIEYDLGERISIGCNLGAEWNGSENGPTATGLYTVVMGYSPTDRLGLFAEFYGFLPEQSGFQDHRFNAGLTYAIAPLVQFDISGGLGISQWSPNHFISTGISFRLLH